MVDIPLFKVFSSPQVIYDLAEVIKSGFVGQGPVNARFETELQAKFGVNYLATTNSATSAQHLAWLLLKNKMVDGDTVLSSPLTCFATTAPIVLSGFRVKWVDIDPETLNMDMDDLARKTTEEVKAIQLIHWGGMPCDLDRVTEIQQVAKEMYGFKPPVLEDCAHSFLSKYKGKLVGTTGNIATFSLQAIKHVQAIDGGFIILPHQDLFRRSKLLKWYGIDRETSVLDFRCHSDISEVGTKWHMNDVCSAVGSANLKYADYIVGKHRDNAAYYDQELKHFSGVKLLKRQEGFDSAFWIYTMKVDDRPNFIKAMKDRGIWTSQVHERNDKYSCMSEFKAQLPNLDSVIDKIVSIPVGWWVEEEDRQRILNCIKKGW